MTPSQSIPHFMRNCVLALFLCIGGIVALSNYYANFKGFVFNDFSQSISRNSDTEDAEFSAYHTPSFSHVLDEVESAFETEVVEDDSVDDCLEVPFIQLERRFQNARESQHALLPKSVVIPQHHLFILFQSLKLDSHFAFETTQA